MLRMECLSGFLNASAKALAYLRAYMANKGTFAGDTLISEETWNDLHSEPKFAESWGGFFPHG